MSKLVIRGLPVPPSIMLAHVAENPKIKNIFEEVDFAVWGDSKQMRQALVDGEVDLAVIPSNAAAGLYNHGLKVRLLGVTLWGILHVLSWKDGVESWNDLKRKTVGIPFKGNMPDTIFNFLARKNGLDPQKDINPVYYKTYVDAKNALLAGEIDAACLPEPVASSAEVESEVSGTYLKRILDLQHEWDKATGRGPRYAQAGPVVQANLIERLPEAGSLIISAIEDALKFMADDPSAAARLGRPLLGGLSEEVIAKSLKRIEHSAETFPAGIMQVESFLNSLAEISSELVPGGIPDHDFYYVSP